MMSAASRTALPHQLWRWLDLSLQQDTLMVVAWCTCTPGYSDLGYRGSGISTPVIDHLALHGVRMSNY